ncbi:MAG: BMP family ABC transporter substrate-binding protein [Oscillospiraceae bacterium]|nr:BMP family ABC transporter substrate-binding protein [Oscillospiraceae bacterium]
MKKQFPALLLTLALLLSLCACGGAPDNKGQSSDANAVEPSPDTQAAPKTIKVGLVCIGDENEGYTYNFIRGKNDASVMLAAEGIHVEWVVKWNVPESGVCEDANRELVAEGCQLIFNNSFGFEEFMLKVAAEYPDVQFVACTNQASRADGLPNTHNAFANIHEGRYLAGIVAGMKLQEMIDSGDITPEQAVIGYVGAFPYAEVISGYTAYFLGARSVCPDVTMKIQFVGSWSDAVAEEKAASALVDMGCILISQHSDTDAPAIVAQSAGILHTGYNKDMTSVAPDASLVSTRIDWYVYFEHAIRAVFNGDELEQDWCHGLDMYAVELTPLNRDLIADGTDEKLDEVKAALADGSLQVFDTSTFTVNGVPLEHAYAIDTDGDFVPDTEEAVFDGAFHESHFQSAPYFTLDIDGIDRTATRRRGR